MDSNSRKRLLAQITEEVFAKKQCYCTKVFKKPIKKNVESHVESCKNVNARVENNTMTSYFNKVESRKKQFFGPTSSGSRDETAEVEDVNNAEENSERVGDAEGDVERDIERDVEGDIEGDVEDVVVLKEVKYCTGLEWHETEFYSMYPFAIHSPDVAPTNTTVSNFVPIDGYIFSQECLDRKKRLENTGESICDNCMNLETLNSYQSIVSRSLMDDAEMITSNISNKFFTHNQLVAKVKKQDNKIKELRLADFNNKKKLSVLNKKLSMHNRFLLTLTEKDVPRLKQLISVCVRQKQGIAYILQKLQKAIAGMYSPKGYNQDDRDLAAYVLISGGPRLLHVLHQTSGLASLSTAYRDIDNANILKDCNITASTTDVNAQIATNVEKVIKEHKEAKSAWSLKVDEIAVDKRLRYNSKTNGIVGLCAQHSTKDDVIFANAQQACNLENQLIDGSLHLATESCVFSVSSLGEQDYHALPVLSYPICSHQTQVEQKSIFAAQLDTWEDLMYDNYYLLNIATDGDSARRSVLHGLRSYKLSPGSRIYNELSSLKYMDFNTCKLDVTIDYDAKHLSKRLRSTIIGGKMVILGKKVDAHVIRAILKAQGMNEREIKPILDPVDKQNVPLAVKLLEALSEDPPESLSVGLKDLLPALKVLQTICIGVLSWFARPSMDIDDILGRVSAMSHLVMFLKHNGDLTIPNVLYHDLQSTVQNSFFMAAKFKVYFPGKKFFIYQSGSDQVEQLFRSVRTQNHDRNCDMFQLESRLLRAAILEHILLKNPTWRQKCNRLSGPVDHTSPAHWTGNQICDDLILSISWNWGKTNAVASLPSGYNINIGNDVTILQPNGYFIGVSAYEEDEEDEIDGIDENDVEGMILLNVA